MAIVPQSALLPSFTGGEWAPSLCARVDMQKYMTALARCRNLIVHAHGGVSNRPGFRYVGACKGTSAVRLIPFQYSEDDCYVLEFGNQYMRVIRNDGYVVYPAGHASAGQIVELATPYAAADLRRINYEQSADVVYLACQGYPPKMLKRTAHHAWTLTDLQFSALKSPPTLSTSEASSQANRYVVTAEYNGQETKASNVVYGANYGTTLSWTEVSGATHYFVYQLINGKYCRLTDGELAATVRTYTTRNGATAFAGPITPPTYYNPFSSLGDYPGLVKLHQNRLLFACAPNHKRTIWGSQTGNFLNFGKHSPLQDDDAYEFTIAGGRMNEIRALAPLAELMLFTAGEEYMAQGGENGITPTAINVKYQSGNGSSVVQPLKISDNVLYVQNSAAAVRDFAYSLESDGYRGNDVSIMANHFFRNHRVVSWCYQRYPDSVVWAVREDGLLLGLTYMREHQVWGWHAHETDGLFRDVCCVSDGDGHDEVYAVVDRVIGDETKRYVEHLATRLPDGDVTKGFFVDCGLSYDGNGETANHLAGLEHLAGREVVALADGKVVKGLTVTPEGTVDLPFAAGRVHVGLPYRAEMMTLDLNLNTQTGTVLDQPRQINSVVIKLEQTRALTVSSGDDDPDPQEINFNAGQNYGEPAPLFTGDKEVNVSAGTEWQQGRVKIVVDEPLPATILGIIPRVEYAN